MKKIFLILYLFFTIANAESHFEEQEKNILVINSYHRGFVWSDRIIKGMENVFKDSNINLNVLYMDSKRINSEEYLDSLAQTYHTQLRRYKYDLIVAIDNFAYNFICKRYNQLNLKQNIYFIGLERYNTKLAKKFNLFEKTSGIKEKRELEANVAIAKRIFPDLEKIYIINDKSLNGDDTEPFIRKLIKKYKKELKIEYIRKMDFKDIKNKFSKYMKNEVVIYVRFYNNKEGSLVKNEILNNFINNIKLPVFVTDDLFIKSAFGGKIVKVEDLGKKAGDKIKKILFNKIKTPIVETYDNYHNVFNYKKILEFNANGRNIRKIEKYELINAPESFFDKHRKFIEFIFLVSPLLVMLILGLIHNIYLKIKSNKKLRQRMQFDKVLLNALRSPTVWQDKNGKIADCNTKFYKLLDMQIKDEKNGKLGQFVKGKNIVQFLKILEKFSNNGINKNETVLVSENGKEHIYIIKKTVYHDDVYGTNGTVIVFTDVTTERKALMEKVKQQEFLVQQSKLAEIGEILSSIAHQWKTPLVEIAAIAQEQLYSCEGEVDEKNSQYVNDLMVQVKYMTQTIEDFQNFIKPSNEKTIFNVKECIEKILEIVDHNIRYNYIKTKIIIQENSKLNIFGYKNEFMQILLNIINNAKDQILNRRVVEKNKNIGNIIININNIEDDLKIEILDDGGGIEEKHINKIFKSDFTTKKNGQGIGLYMAKTIIDDKMGGEITVANEKNGAKFIIKIKAYDENTSFGR